LFLETASNIFLIYLKKLINIRYFPGVIELPFRISVFTKTTGTTVIYRTQTDTGGLVEYTKVLGITMLKELGKIAL